MAEGDRAGGAWAATPLETAVVAAFPYLVAGLLLSLPLLAVPTSVDRTALFISHLSALVLIGVLLTDRIAPQIDAEWFPGQPWRPVLRRFAGAASLVVISTGVVALVTLASSAALRYQPSTQFLQLISALDIAWASAAVMVGAYRLWGRAAAWLGGALVGIVCVAAIWNYLRVVGFAVDGGWIVDGRRLGTLVIPVDMVVALLAVVLVVGAVRKDPQATAQARDQS